MSPSTGTTRFLESHDRLEPGSFCIWDAPGAICDPTALPFGGNPC